MAQPQYTHGRGGAGNMGKDGPSSGDAADFVTPTLKSDKYTTGRGGQGNMAKNDYGAEARAAQDVEIAASLQRDHEDEPVHYGRGGAANVAKKNAKSETEGKAGETAGDKPKGFLEKLGLKKH